MNSNLGEKFMYLMELENFSPGLLLFIVTHI